MDGETAHYGKKASDLQENIELKNGKITGTLKYVKGFTEFSGDATEQNGNYLVLDLSAGIDTTITTRVVGGTHDPVTVTDGFCIYRITATTQKITVTAAKAGDKTKTITYDLTELTLAQDAAA